MKQYRTPMILAALALVLGLAYFAITGREGVEDTGIAFSLQNGESISDIALENTFGSFHFTTTEGVWSVGEGGKQYRVFDERMKLMLGVLAPLTVSRVLDGALPEYGLDAPQATVRVTTTKNRTVTFQIGAETTSHSGVYLRQVTDGKVMVATSGLAAQFTGSLAAYRAKNVFTIDEYSIRQLSYYQDGQLVVSAGNNGPQDWFLTYPFQAPARAIELGEVVTAITGWTVAGYPQDSDYAAMGLDAPSTWLELTDAAGHTQTFQFGATDGGSGTYVRTGDESEIVKLYTVDLDFSVLTPNALLFIAPLKTTVDRVASIAVRTAEGETRFDVEQVEGGQNITCGGRAIANDAFVSVFFKYIAMNANGWDPVAAVGEPIAILTTTYIDGSTTSLELLSRDEDSYTMVVDGKTDYYLAAEKLDQLVYRIQKALE